MNSLGSILKRLRKQRELTLKNASQRAGISLSFLSDIERGRTEPSLKTLRALASIYCTTLAALFLETTP